MSKALLRLLVLVFIASSALDSRAQGALTISGTEVFDIVDPETNSSYRLHIALPSGYEGSLNRFPVVYLLDGDWYFTLAVSTARLLEVNREMRSVILVGIGYGGSIVDQRSRRLLEFTPIREESLAGSGNAAAFLNALGKRIIPAVESRYRTATDRTLVGHSLGGLFATFAMVRGPELFDRVVIGSPALWSSRTSLLAELSARVEKGLPLPRRIFVGIASGDFTAIQGDYAVLRAWLKRAPANVQWSAEEFANSTHQSVVPSLLARALPWILADAPR